MPEDVDVAPWDRQAGEPSLAFQAFVVYRDLGPLHRSLSECSRILQSAKREYSSRLTFPDLPPEQQPSQDPATNQPVPDGHSGHSGYSSYNGHTGSIGLWSSKYHWVDRAQAWDQFVDQTRQRAYVDQVAQMAERQANEAALCAKAAMVGVSEFIRSLNDPNRVNTLRVMRTDQLLGIALECMKQIPKLQDAERTARGARVMRPGEEDSIQGGDIEWVVNTYQPPRQGPPPEIALAAPAQPTKWEGDTPPPEEEDPAEGQAYPPADYRL